MCSCSQARRAGCSRRLGHEYAVTFDFRDTGTSSTCTSLNCKAQQGECVMRFLAYRQGVDGIAMESARGELLGLRSDHPNYPGSLDDLVGNDEGLRVAASAISQYGQPLGLGKFAYLAPL